MDADLIEVVHDGDEVEASLFGRAGQRYEALETGFIGGVREREARHVVAEEGSHAMKTSESEGQPPM